MILSIYIGTTSEGILGTYGFLLRYTMYKWVETFIHL